MRVLLFLFRRMSLIHPFKRVEAIGTTMQHHVYAAYPIHFNSFVYVCRSLCSYVCIGQRHSNSKFLFSLFVCMYWTSKTSTLPKWNISLCWYVNKKLDKIFHFVRVCWSWKSNAYVWTEMNKSFETEYFWPIHTYIWAEREREREREKQVD